MLTTIADACRSRSEVLTARAARRPSDFLDPKPGDLDYTLGLVMTNSCLREEGPQGSLISVSLDAGAGASRESNLRRSRRVRIVACARGRFGESIALIDLRNRSAARAARTRERANASEEASRRPSR